MSDIGSAPSSSESQKWEDQTPTKQKRPKGILRRWLHMVIFGFAGACLCLLLAPQLNLIARAIQETPSQHLLPSLSLFVILASWMIWRVASGRLSAFLGIRHFWRFPPIWVAGMIGLAALICASRWGCCSLAGIDDFMLEWSPWIALAFVFVIGLISTLCKSVHQHLVRLRKTASPEHAPRARTILDWASDFAQHDALVAWFTTDDEVARPEDDRFGHDAIAQRIVRRISVPQGPKNLPTIAVVGPLGSGKSTIARLVEYHANSVPNVEIVRLSLWPFDSPDAAVRGILNALLKGLSLHASTLHIAGIPEEYASIIEQASGRWGSLARFFASPRQPGELLDRLGDLARLLGIRVILWIEDLERFASSASRDHEDAEADARLNPIRALLYLLDQCEQISVIVADCSLDSRFDLDKIARYIERVPELDPEIVRQLFRGYRDECLRKMKPMIDPVPSRLRNEFLSINNLAVRALLRHEPDRLDCETAIANILSTPRLLKNALRSAHDAWDILAGEIDLDDILLASVIRTARPAVFSFVDRYISTFRMGFHARIPLRDSSPEDHPVYKDFLLLLERETNRESHSSVVHLAEQLFPALPRKESGFVDTDRRYIEHPQCLSEERHIDYWRRYLLLQPIPENESDQAALRSIVRWQQQQPCDLVERLCTYELSEQIEHFVGVFEATELVTLLHNVVVSQRTTSANAWRNQSDAPGIIPLWRMMHRKSPPAPMLFDNLLELIRMLGPLHLPLIHALEYYIASPGKTTFAALLSNEQQLQVAEEVVHVLLSYCEPQGGERLLTSLRKGAAHTLFWLAWGLDRLQRSDERNLPFDNWERFASLMLAAAELNPTVGLAQVIPFITNMRNVRAEDEGGLRSVPQFERETAERLFDFPQLRDMLADSEIPEDATGDILLRWRKAKEECLAIRATENAAS